MKTDKEITAFIKREIEKQDVTLEQIAAGVKIVKATVHNRLSGVCKGGWDLEMLNKWGEVLGFKAEMIITRTRQPAYLAHADRWTPERIAVQALAVAAAEAREEQEAAQAEQEEWQRFLGVSNGSNGNGNNGGHTHG